MAPSEITVSIKLDGPNDYHRWLPAVRAKLADKKVLYIVDGTNKRPGDPSMSDADNIAKGILVESLSADL